MATDWGTQDWSEDLDAAKAQALTWLSQVATAKDWSTTARSAVQGYIQAAYEEADGWFSDDIKGFFQGVINRMDANPVGSAPNWTALRNTYASAIGATATVEQARSAGSTSAVLRDTVDQSIEDVEDAAAVVKKAANPEKSLVPWLVGLAILGAILKKVS